MAQDDSIYLTLATATALFCSLVFIFDRIRSRLWYIYEPKAHHPNYKTPTPPGPGMFAFIGAVARAWSGQELVEFGGVDAYVLVMFLDYALDQCFFAAILGVCVLLPIYYSSSWLENHPGSLGSGNGPSGKLSFSLTTALNIHCRIRQETEKRPLFPACKNKSGWRFAVMLVMAWILTLRALSKLSIKCCEYVELRQRYLRTRLNGSAKELQVALSVMVERVPKHLQSMTALKRYFELLCGEGSVHAVRIMVKDLSTLTALYHRREQALEAAIAARSRRVKAIRRLFLEPRQDDRFAPPPSLSVLASLKASSSTTRRYMHVAISGVDRERAVRLREEAIAAEEAATVAELEQRLRESNGRLDSVAMRTGWCRRCKRNQLKKAVVHSVEHVYEVTAPRALRFTPTARDNKNTGAIACKLIRACLGRSVPGGNRFRKSNYVEAIPYYDRIVDVLAEEITRQHILRAAASIDEALAAPYMNSQHATCQVAGSEHVNYVETREKGLAAFRHDKPVLDQDTAWYGLFWALRFNQRYVESAIKNAYDADDAANTELNCEYADTSSVQCSSSQGNGISRCSSCGVSASRDDNYDEREASHIRCFSFHPQAYQAQLRERYVRHVLRGKHMIVVFATESFLTVAIPTLWERLKLNVLHFAFVSVPNGLLAIFKAGRSVVVDYMLCGHHDDILATKEAAFHASSTAFVTFTLPTARLLALHTTLSGQPFGMFVTPAPEARDVVWNNVHEEHGAIGRRTQFVSALLFLLVLFWTAVVAATSNSQKIGVFLPKSRLQIWVGSVLPVATLIAVINLLPLIFQALAKFYERRKSISSIDISIVDRFFRFQAINIYVSIFASALLLQLKEAWKNPYAFIVTIGSKTPAASLFLAKFLALTAGTAPLWCLRAWPLISRGWNWWTIRPPELPGVLFGWALPKLIMNFTIVTTFWIFSPLTSVIGLVYFSVVSVFFRYLILFVHMPFYESGGMFFDRVVNSTLLGLGVANSILFFWFLTKALVGMAILIAPLPFIVYAFARFAGDAYFTPTRTSSLDAARAYERLGSELPRFEPTMYTQPAMRRRPPLKRQISQLVTDAESEPNLLAVLARDVDPSAGLDASATELAAQFAAYQDTRPSIIASESVKRLEAHASPARKKAVFNLLDKLYRGEVDLS